jgi:hypothetical protein
MTGFRKRLYSWATKDFEGSAKIRSLLRTPERTILVTIFNFALFLSLVAYADAEFHSVFIPMIFLVLMFIFLGIIIIHAPKDMEMLG